MKEKISQEESETQKIIDEYSHDLSRAEQLKALFEMPGWQLVKEEFEIASARLNNVDNYETFEDFRAGKMANEQLNQFIGRLGGIFDKGDAAREFLTENIKREDS